MRVDIARPVISGDTITFSWTQSEPNPFQRDNRFAFRYQAIDPNQFTDALFYEIFLAMQLRVFAQYDGPVEAVFPEPVSPHSIAFCRAYHGATRVSISPVSEPAPYSPWKAGRPSGNLPSPRPYGAMFGGGKDSTLSACMLAEIYGADQVVLFQMVTPYRAGAQEATRIEQRQEHLVLRPMRERVGVTTHHAWTDFIAGQTEQGRKLRPHLELYTAGFLPAMLHWGVSMMTTSYAWSAFPFRRLSNDRLWFRYPLSRPETLATQSDHYRRAGEIDITLTNVHLLFSPLTAFRLLAERYRASLPGIVMCDYAGIGDQWCFQCRKCAEFAYYGLAHGFVEPRFDYNRLFARSTFINKVIAYLESGVEQIAHGNVPVERVMDLQRVTSLRDEA